MLQNPQQNPFQLIMRAAHVIKGAAANLMCGQLRAASMQLEQSAAQAHEAGETVASPDRQHAVQAGYAALRQAAHNYGVFLKSIDVG
jgi:HPt (histidine-containing phosphotransfer) domain-containing protein